MLVITFGFAESTPPGVHAGCENQRLALHILKLQNFVPEHIERRILIPFLGEVPLVQSIREAGDVGRPAALQEEGLLKEAFEEITRNVVRELVVRHTDLPPTEAIKITTMAGCSAVKPKK